jgi:hypothetical protein
LHEEAVEGAVERAGADRGRRDVEGVVDQLLESEAAQVGLRDAGLLRERLDGSEQGPVRALELKIRLFRVGV